MLTPAYPGGLFGDRPGTVTWADGTPGAAVAPGFGTPESVYGTPGGYGYPAPGGYSAPQGYGYPGEYGQPGAYGQPEEYGQPQGYGQPEGYGYPAAAGYGSAAPMGYSGQPAFQPPRWLLSLPAAAKRLVTVFIVLGTVFVIAYIALIAIALGSAGNQASSIVTAQDALNQVGTSYNTLTTNLTSWENATKACNGNLTCVTGQDVKAAGYLTSFHHQLTGIPMPPDSVAAATRLDQDTTKAVAGFTQLSKVTTAAQYNSVFASTGLETTLNNFDTDYTALVNALQSN